MGSGLTDQMRAWYERSPKAQRAIRRLGADLDTVAARVESATSNLRERISPIIDPSTPAQAPTEDGTPAAAKDAETAPGASTTMSPADTDEAPRVNPTDSSTGA